jgi:hypothetical protein
MLRHFSATCLLAGVLESEERKDRRHASVQTNWMPAGRSKRRRKMKFLLLLLLWCVLFVLSWPIAILALVLFPLVWLICLPLRLVGFTVHAVFAFVKTLLFLPARLLGYRPGKAQAS